MPDRVTTSFIPKESLVTERAPRPSTRSPLAFVNLIAGAILVISILACGGMFLFQTYTESSIVSKQESLDRQRAAFEPATIQELLRLDRRLMASEELLRSHVAVSQLFSDLESRTGTNVRFRDFKYESLTAGKKTVTMSGTARSFNSVALQADAFGKSTLFKDPIFSNLNIDKDGIVIFDFSGVIDTARLNYSAVATAPTIEEPAVTETSPLP